ncbi:flagellar hook-basal body protein [Desulfofalx alkaliphila]|uniref:flagellar hook-basal body protein n=1 Tax=Desulfofalx alkaliphila TaxID=105483 RepID=UPI0004E0F22E|nr:flagellar hook-basal body complex protein [Desulfofalx alkaliphila]
MLRSLYSGVAGLGAHRTRMDVIGNNIANVNTTAFKNSRANFEDVLYQKISSGGNSKNAAFVGTGVNVAGISTDFTQGALQNTGRTLDLAIQGEGFFVVSNDGTVTDGAAFDPTQRRVNFTRDGVFFIDKDGFLVNSNGYKVLADAGTNQTRAIQIDLEDSSGNPLTVETINISPDGQITGTYTNGAPLTFDGVAGNSVQLSIATFANNEGLDKVGNNLFAEAASISGDAVYGVASGETSIASGYLEMSNVDLSNEFVNIITTQRGFQANARTITVSDSILEELINLKR